MVDTATGEPGTDAEAPLSLGSVQDLLARGMFPPSDSSLAPEGQATTAAPTDGRTDPPSGIEAPGAPDEEPVEDAPEDGDAEDLDEAALTEMVTMVAESGRRILEVPRKHQGKVVETTINALVAGFEKGRQQIFEAGHATALLQIKAREIEDLGLAGDRQAFDTALEKFPGGKQNYLRVLAGDVSTAGTETPQKPTAVLTQQKANDLFARLAEFPQAQVELRTGWDYKETEEDLVRLALRIGELLGREKTRKAAGSPEARALAERAANRERIAGAARTDASKGAPETREGIASNDVGELLRMGMRDAASSGKR